MLTFSPYIEFPAPDVVLIIVIIIKTTLNRSERNRKDREISQPCQNAQEILKYVIYNQASHYWSTGNSTEMFRKKAGGTGN